MRKFSITGAVLASALAVAGCGQAAEKEAPADNAANAAAPAEPAGDAEAAAPAAPAGDQTNQNFTLNNQTGHTVVTLNVSPSDSDEWGPDILGTDMLANGQSAQITFPRAEAQCQWDIRATYDDGDTTDARGVNLCELTTVNLTAGE